MSNTVYSSETVMHHTHGLLPQLLLSLPFVIGFFLYFLAIGFSGRQDRKWPLHRTAFWIFGISAAIIAVSGPVAEHAYTNFFYHMAGHILLGMLSPLLIALSAPLTLLLRSLSVPSARKVSRVLRSKPANILRDPVIASLLNIGGIWLLYTTRLFEVMHEQPVFYLFIHLHIFLAGYLFTISFLYIDPASHRRSYLYRSVVLISAIAGHGILSKYIYANPPPGVPANQAEVGAMLMYYGGDAVDIVLIFLLCLHWYRSTEPKASFITPR